MNENLLGVKKLLQARAGEQVSQPERLQFARAVTSAVVQKYWHYKCPGSSIPDFLSDIRPDLLRKMDLFLCDRFAHTVSGQDTLSGSYLMGCLYTALIPKDMRSRYGVYYTPPALSKHLIHMTEQAGADWRQATVLDPACGGGAFLAPVARRMLDSLKDLSPEARVEHLSFNLAGMEIDPFAAWLAQVFLEIVVREICPEVEDKLPKIVRVRDTLQDESIQTRFDVVIGNPPYGRVRLSKVDRGRFKRSLYGHANLYGLFTDQALSLVREGGYVAYVTPTSFLSGQYFKNLRKLLARKAPPVSLDFIAARSNVFENVLQETMLAVYRCGEKRTRGMVQVLDVIDSAQLNIIPVGEFSLPPAPSGPWFVPRSKDQAGFARCADNMPARLRDLGFKVSTGPLVWNRHKQQLRDDPGEGCYPLIWAEAVCPDGVFRFRAEKRGHKPYFKVFSPGDDWLTIDQPCALLQRTTAKEQKRRLIAAEIPAPFIKEHGKVVVENHLNMVVSLNGVSEITAETMVVVLNSSVVDQVFRCLNGSVAVSAYELEAMPLPSLEQLLQIQNMIRSGVPREHIEKELERYYVASSNVWC